MADGDSRANVTRREFYGALALLWFYIMLVIADLLRIEWRWSTGALWAASLFLACMYVVTSFRASRARTTDWTTSPPPSDRVREIARDPSRKIEAIKVYREETGLGLAEAKEVVENYIDSQ
jgi:Ribosomal protein L7/L12 C-terminal domain